jgi:hypothetical protein
VEEHQGLGAGPALDRTDLAHGHPHAIAGGHPELGAVDGNSRQQEEDEGWHRTLYGIWDVASSVARAY